MTCIWQYEAMTSYGAPFARSFFRRPVSQRWELWFWIEIKLCGLLILGNSNFGWARLFLTMHAALVPICSCMVRILTNSIVAHLVQCWCRRQACVCVVSYFHQSLQNTQKQLLCDCPSISLFNKLLSVEEASDIQIWQLWWLPALIRPGSVGETGSLLAFLVCKLVSDSTWGANFFQKC